MLVVGLLPWVVFGWDNNTIQVVNGTQTTFTGVEWTYGCKGYGGTMGGPVAPGASVTKTGVYIDGNNGNCGIGAYVNPYGYWDYNLPIQPNNGGFYRIVFGIDPGVETNCCSSVKVINLDMITRSYSITTNGVEADAANGQFFQLPPGGSTEVKGCGPCPFNLNVYRWASFGEPRVDGTYHGEAVTNSPSSNSTPTNAPLHGIGDNQAAWTTNLFGSSSPSGSTNWVVMLSTVYGQMSTAASTLQESLNRLASAVSNVAVTGGGPGLTSSNVMVTMTVTNNISTTYSNQVSVGLTNFNTFTNYVNVSNTNINNVTVTNPPIDLSAITNLLAQILGTGIGTTNALGTMNNTQLGMSNLLAVIAGRTNGFGTGDIFSGSSEMMGLVPSWSTNLEAATAYGNQLLDGSQSRLEQGTGYVQNGSSAAIGNLSGAGDASGLHFEFCGRVVSLDPADRFPGFMGLVRSAWSFIALMLFGRWVVGWVQEIIQLIGTAETGGVPNLEAELFGFGGNVAGLAVYLATIVVFIASWVVVLNWVGLAILDFLGLFPQAGAAVGLGGNAIALYLLNACFPVSLALSLASARVTLPLTGSKVCLVAIAVSRMLAGK